MTTVSATPSTIPTEKELRRLLALRHPDDVATLLALLENPAPDAQEAIVSLLAHIAKDAQSFHERLTDAFVKAVTLLMVVLAVYLVAYIRRKEAPYTVIVIGIGCMLSILLNTAVYGPEKGRVANHAALLLARVNDLRAVRPLANLWTPCPLSLKERAFNADVSRELARLLVERGGKRFDRATEKALRALVEKALPNGRLAKAVSRLRPSRDLTETDMDLLLTVVRHLAQPCARRDPHTAEPNADTATLQNVAALSTPGTNYNLLRDTTQLLLTQRGSEAP